MCRGKQRRLQAFSSPGRGAQVHVCLLSSCMPCGLHRLCSCGCDGTGPSIPSNAMLLQVWALAEQHRRARNVARQCLRTRYTSPLNRLCAAAYRDGALTHLQATYLTMSVRVRASNAHALQLAAHWQFLKVQVHVQVDPASVSLVLLAGGVGKRMGVRGATHSGPLICSSSVVCTRQSLHVANKQITHPDLGFCRHLNARTLAFDALCHLVTTAPCSEAQ
jgi:hypothetical protein